MNKNSFSKKICQWSTHQRIELAKITIKKLTYLVIDVVQLHETNKILTYSNKLASQIPTSRAARAYNSLQRSLYEYEVIRVCSFWDLANENAQTIPTIVELIDDEEVIRVLANVLRSQWDDGFGDEQATKLKIELEKIIIQAGEVLNSDRYEAIKLIRNKHLAHCLTQTREEMASDEAVAKMKYGYERDLLRETVEIVQQLYRWVNGSDFDMVGECTNRAQENAEDLWYNCKFEIKERKFRNTI